VIYENSNRVMVEMPDMSLYENRTNVHVHACQHPGREPFKIFFSRQFFAD
jgi:hypothetical protein